MKSSFAKWTVALALVAGFPVTVHAGEFHCNIGLSYASGIHESFNDLKDLYEDAGFTIDEEWEVPLGLSVFGYYEFDCGGAAGLSLGPTTIFAVEEDTGSSEDTFYSAIIPVGADLRFTFLREHKVTPYLRVGFRYPIVAGDNLDSSEPGVYGGIGVEVFRNKVVGFGFEFGYDSSRVTLKGPTGEKEDQTYGGFIATVNVVF